MFKKILVFVLLLVTPLSLNAYELSDKDYIIIEKIEQRVFDLLDNNLSLYPEDIVLLFEKYSKKSESERLKSILEVIIDDIEYSYYLGEYSDELTLESEECYPGEFYDEEYGFCYVLEEEDDYESDYGELLNHDSHYVHDENSELEDFESEYLISGNKISLLAGKETSKSYEIWDLFIKLIPEASRSDFINYNVINDSNSDTYAYVEQNSDDKNKWDLVVNISLFYKDGNIDKKESIHTLIHEYSHVLSLNKTQVKYDLPEQYCNTNYISEGCLRSNAYLNLFINKFWKQNFEASQLSENNDFYSGNEDDFVSDYAATNPGEDIAETFVYFVLQDKPETGKISDNKILFMYQENSLVNLRTLIRNRINLINN